MESILEKDENSETETPIISSNIKRGFAKYSRKLIFYLIFFINLFNHLDHGAISACNTYLMNELNLTHADLGFIGSLVYLGLTFGAILAGYIFNIYTPKWIVSISILLTCIFLYSLTISNTFISLCISRFLCGFFQVFCMIYFPVWVDQFGVYEFRTIWLSYLQLGPACGTMIGYTVEAIGIKQFGNWRYGFYFQIFFLGLLTSIFLLTPDKTFDRNYKRTNITREFIKNNIVPDDELYKKYKIINGNKYKNLSDFSIFSLNEDEYEHEEFKYIEAIKNLYSNKIYKYTLIGICCLLFIVTGVQFWITDYMLNNIEYNLNRIFVTFAVVCLTAPTLGVLIGGYLIEKIGGYTNKHALKICFHSSVIAGCCGMPLPLCSNYWTFTLLMWFTLFFGGSIMPGLTGILLNSLDANMKEAGNSITQIIYNLIGYFPAPFLYGLVCNLTGGKKSKWGLIMLMSFTVVGMFYLKKANDFQEENFYNGLSKSILRDAHEGDNKNINFGLDESIEYFKRNSIMFSRLYGKSQNNFLLNEED